MNDLVELYGDITQNEDLSITFNEPTAEGARFYEELYDLILPTRAVVMINGRIVVDGGPEVFKRIDQHGYEFIKTELGIEIEKEEPEMNKVSIGSCAVKDAIK